MAGVLKRCAMPGQGKLRYLALVMAASLVGCATESEGYHGFDFRPLVDSPGLRG